MKPHEPPQVTGAQLLNLNLPLTLNPFGTESMIKMKIKTMS